MLSACYFLNAMHTKRCFVAIAEFFNLLAAREEAIFLLLLLLLLLLILSIIL